MKRSLLLLTLLALFAAPSLIAVQQTRAADAVVELSTVENNYPKDVTFRLGASAPTNIVDVTLRFKLAGQNSSALGKPEPADLTAGTKISTKVKVNTTPGISAITVGNEFVYQWEITQADGTVTLGKEERFLYLPSGREWKSLSNSVGIVYFTGSRESLVQKLLDAMDVVSREHGQKLLKVTLGKPVKVVLLGTAEDVKEAQAGKGTTFDNSGVVTCGFRPSNVDDLIISTISCGGAEPIDTVRHEFGHVLNAAAGQGLVGLPLWVDEGLAVYAQEKKTDYESAYRAAQRGNRLIPFRQMTLAISDPNQTILQYGQALAMVSYLIDKYTPAKLNELMAATKSNTRFDEALKKVYGFDIDGFEKEFLAAAGGGTTAPTVAPTQPQRPVQSPTVVPTVRPAQNTQPTAAPTPAAAVVSTDDGSGIGKATIGIIGAAVVLLLMAVMAFLVMMFLQNQRLGQR